MLSLNIPTMPIFPLNITKLSIFKRLDLPRATLVFVPERKESVFVALEKFLQEMAPLIFTWSQYFQYVIFSVTIALQCDQSDAPKRQFLENIGSEDNLSSTIFGTFVVKFLATWPVISALYFQAEYH